MKKNNNEMGGIVALVLGAILCVGMGLVTGVKTCGKMIWALLKSARRFITGYLTGPDADRSTLISSLKSTLKTITIALAIVLVGGVCVNILFGAAREIYILSFIPKFVMDAIGYLAFGIGLRAIVWVAEKVGLRSDVTVKVRKLVEFGMSALVPVALIQFLDHMSTEGVFLIFSTCIASWGYRKINEWRADAATPAASATTK